MRTVRVEKNTFLILDDFDNKENFYINHECTKNTKENKKLEPISKLEIFRLDEARAFRKAQFTRSKRAFEKGDNEV